MSSQAYEIVALFMRYVFVFIGALIVWRSFVWLRRDARAYKKEMRSLPDAGLVGEIVNLNTGEAQPLPHEGAIGSGRDCDIRLKGEGVSRCHARFAFVEGKGLQITPTRRSPMLLGGVQLTGPGYALHGTQLQIGNTVLRVRLFAGLKVPYPARYQEPDAILGSQAYLQPWQGGGEAVSILESAPSLPTQDGQADYVPYDLSTIPQGAPVNPYAQPDQDAYYDGGYTEDGQMTWQYAYSLEDLRRAMDAESQPEQYFDGQEDNSQEEGIPYQSPLPRRRRRSRHEKQ